MSSSRRIVPLGPESWSLFEELVERNKGIFGGCWCIGYHPECGQIPASAHRDAKQDRVVHDEAHAALVLDDDGVCQAWAQFGSPEELAGIKHKRAYDKEALAVPDWRLTCVYVDPKHRGQGYARAAIGGALSCISEAGGGTVEAISETTDARVAQGRFLFSGTAELLEEFGFVRVRQVGKYAWVMTATVEDAQDRAALA